MQKGAMFGLDARIALAIFGALSVISGAALYSAIQNSEATSILSEMNEIGKAWEQYLLDTGSDLPVDGGNAQLRNLNELLTSGVTGWKGPYLSYSRYLATSYLTHSKYWYIQMVSATDDTFGASGDWFQTHTCGVSDICYNWILFRKISSLAVVENIDSIVDNSDGADAGRLRWYVANDGEDFRTMYRYASYKKPE